MKKTVNTVKIYLLYLKNGLENGLSSLKRLRPSNKIEQPLF